MKKFAQSLLGITAAIAVTLTAGPAAAEYPEKPINVIVPWGAGGDSDLTTRLWADAMEGILGGPVVVINKAGGGGVIGTTFVANSAKDGYTLINAGLSNVLVTPNFNKTPYDFASFEPVVKLSSVPLGILVPADSPYKTFDDFIAAAKAGKVTQGSWGAASSGTVLANIIADQAGYTVKYVHGNTTAESMVALIGGHIDSAVSFPPAFGPHVKSGRARLLVLNQKMDEYPNVPTFADYGIKGSFEGWSGVFAPKGTPADVIQKLVTASTQAMEDPKVRQAFANMGANVDFRHGDAWVKDMLETYDIMKDAAAKMKQ
ncbi:MAG: tripartite tricarboxylate transporter substrate binding protein [Denitromonas halophila]|nr:MAG: tripartite tricarboxylate transporter substrate binding protein [Denitromonas halophila]TVT70506.1 MAG: tripartite tricarboxylate transporter substrate binding protein [Denitromonas halophila]